MPSKNKSEYRSSDLPAALLFLAPALILYLTFTIVPLLVVFASSTLKFRGVAISEFVGLDNFTRLFTSPTYSSQIFNAFANNWYFFIGTMLVQNTLGLGLALLLHRQGLGKRFFQTVIATPFLVNPLVVGYAWLLLLNPTFGPVAQIMDSIGLSSLIRPWLGDPAWARPTVVLINAWHWVGFPMLIFLAALGSIPDELFQAARLDRATPWQTFWYVTLPLISPAAVTVSILTFVGCFNAFNLQFAVGGPHGAPAATNDVLGLVFYRLAFGGDLNSIGSSSALATCMFLFVFVIALFMRYGLGRAEQRIA